MDLSSQMVLFAKVVESGSFSAASRALGVSPSAVSRQIGFLEDRHGIRLVHRTRKGLSLTEEGRAFHDRCRVIADRVAEAEAFAADAGAREQGRLRVASTVAFGKAQLVPRLPAFLERYPGIQISLDLSDRLLDMVAEGFDVAIRFSEQIEDESLIVRKLVTTHRVICAAPSYLARAGTPAGVADLAEHNCLQLSTIAEWNDWHLGDPADETQPAISGNFETSSAEGVHIAALAGIGIARLPTYIVADDLQTGRLVRLFPDTAEQTADIFIVYPERRNLLPRVRAFIDFLIAEARFMTPSVQA